MLDGVIDAVKGLPTISLDVVSWYAPHAVLITCKTDPTGIWESVKLPTAVATAESTNVFTKAVVAIDVSLSPLAGVGAVGLPDRLGQVVVNLIENAITFSPQKSSISITLRKSFRRVVELTIEDAGPGIPDELTDRVFERFYTNRSGESLKKNSSGLGLFICKQIVEDTGVNKFEHDVVWISPLCG